MHPFSGLWRLIAVRAARAPAGLERGGDRSAGPAGGRAARGERSEAPWKREGGCYSAWVALMALEPRYFGPWLVRAR